MLPDDPRTRVLKDLRDQTINFIVPPFLSDAAPTQLISGYASFADLESTLLVLFLAVENRMLCYAAEIPTFAQSVKFGEVGEDDYDGCEFMCRRKTMAGRITEKAVGSFEISDFDEMVRVVPDGEESADDFVIRNAVWLANPTFH